MFDKTVNRRRNLIVLPLTSSAELVGQSLPNLRKKDFMKATNPNDRTYIIAIAFEDFIDIGKLEGFDYKGTIFQKIIAIRTKIPVFGYFFDILNHLLDELKVSRNMEISDLLSQGTGELDLSNFDSEYSTNLIFNRFMSGVEDLPTFTDMKFGDRLYFRPMDRRNGDILAEQQAVVTHQICSDSHALFMECLAPSRFYLIRSERLFEGYPIPRALATGACCNEREEGHSCLQRCGHFGSGCVCWS